MGAANFRGAASTRVLGGDLGGCRLIARAAVTYAALSAIERRHQDGEREAAQSSQDRSDLTNARCVALDAVREDAEARHTVRHLTPAQSGKSDSPGGPSPAFRTKSPG